MQNSVRTPSHRNLHGSLRTYVLHPWCSPVPPQPSLLLFNTTKNILYLRAFALALSSRQPPGSLSLLKCHLFGEVFPGHPTQNGNLSLSVELPVFFILLYFLHSTHHLTYHKLSLLPCLLFPCFH